MLGPVIGCCNNFVTLLSLFRNFNVNPRKKFRNFIASEVKNFVTLLSLFRNFIVTDNQLTSEPVTIITDCNCVYEKAQISSVASVAPYRAGSETYFPAMNSTPITLSTCPLAHLERHEY